MSKFHTVMALSALVLAGAPPLAGADTAAPSGEVSGDTASRLESTLLVVARDSDKLFADMQEGRLQQQDFERRVVELSYRYDELITRDANNVNTLILYGKFLRRVGQNDTANTMFLHADRLSPNLAVVKQQLGNYMAEEGNYPGALALYLKACELEPGEAVYHFGMGELLATFRDKFIADGAFSDEGIDAEILSAFAKAAALDPTNKDFAFRHAEAYYDISSPKWSEALAEWTKIASRSDLTRYEKDAARLHLARVNCELGRNAEALALVRDDVVPVLQATRARLLRRISSVNTASEDRANASAVLPPEQRPAQGAGKAVLPDAPSSAINAAEKSGGQ